MTEVNRDSGLVIVDGFVQPLAPDARLSDFEANVLVEVTDQLSGAGYKATQALINIVPSELTVEEMALASLFRGSADASREQYALLPGQEDTIIGPYVRPSDTSIKLGVAIWRLSKQNC